MVYTGVDHWPAVCVMKLPSKLAEICLKTLPARGCPLEGTMMTRNSFRFESFTLDLERLCLRGPSGQVDVRRKSFDVLRYLIEHAGRVVSKEELIGAVWPDVTVGDESLTQCISEVRRALDDEGQRIIRTVPRRGYLIGVPVSADDTTAVQTPIDASALSESSSPGRPLPDRASIAVLPLANLGHDPQLEYFADGIAEDIITDLSRFSQLFVIARNSSFQYKGKLIDVRQVGRALGVHYVLEGSIRRCGDSVRVSLQLIDAQTGAHRWAERYDRQIDEVFRVQDQAAHSVAAILAAHMSKAESERTALKPPATWQAYDYYRRAADAYADFHRPMEVASIYKARALIEQCLAIDPNFARAYVLLSQTQLSTWAIPLDDDFTNPAVLEAGYRAAEKAVQLDSNLPQARYQLGLSLSFKGQTEAAVAECERAVALNPSYTDWRFIIVLVRVVSMKERPMSARRICVLIPSRCRLRAVGWGSHIICSEGTPKRLPRSANLPCRHRITRDERGWPQRTPKWEDSKRCEQKWPTFCGEIRVGHADSRGPFIFSTKMPIICWRACARLGCPIAKDCR